MSLKVHRIRECPACERVIDGKQKYNYGLIIQSIINECPCGLTTLYKIVQMINSLHQQHICKKLTTIVLFSEDVIKWGKWGGERQGLFLMMRADSRLEEMSYYIQPKYIGNPKYNFLEILGIRMPKFYSKHHHRYQTSLLLQLLLVLFQPFH